MALNQEGKQLSIEERKRNREKFMIKEKENETIYRHYGDLNGADFKLRNNKHCEIYILDWSKGMYIDNCEDCKIFCGPIDGSIFIRGSKNCQISLIARQVRFRDCENLKIFTYCPSDPAVENSFNIYFAPFNAFFPHLKELFVKGEFKKEESNHIDTPYDFTPNTELGGGAPHHLKLPEEEFFIKVIEDGKAPVEEMFDGYSQEEPWVKNKSSDLPNFEQNENNNNEKNDDFNFMSENENKNDNQPQPILNDFIMSSDNDKEKKNNNNDNNDNFMNMDDFLPSNNNTTNQNNNNNFDFGNKNENNNNNFDFGNKNENNNLMDMNDFLGGNNNSSQPKQNNDFNFLNMNNNNSNDNSMNNNFFNNNSQKGNANSFNYNMSKESEEELKRQELRNKEREMRQAKIKEKMEKEAKLRTEIMAKAAEYMTQFFEERQKRIAQNHEKLMKENNNQNNGSENPWQMVESSFKGSSSSADRMKEVILNKNKNQ